MSATLGVLALVLLGAGGEPRPAAPQIVYQFRVLEMTGVEWREGVYPSLQPVTRQGSATIWTTTDAVAETLAKKADRVVAAPNVTALSDAPAHVTTKASRRVVTHVSCPGDAPSDCTANAAYAPETETIRDGFATTVSGRGLDQGVLVKLVLDDTRVPAVHPVYLTSLQTPKPDSDHKAAKSELVQAKLDIPEVIQNELAGEWLIPKHGVLLASLGAHCEADANGKAVVRERLVLVKAEAVTTPFTVALAPGHRPVPAADEPAKPMMPAPSAPSRTLPQALDLHGEPVPLPPLPPEAPAPTARPDSAEPVATPQTKHVPQPEPKHEDKTDDEATRPTSFEGAKTDPIPKPGKWSLAIVLPNGTVKFVDPSLPQVKITVPRVKPINADAPCCAPTPSADPTGSGCDAKAVMPPTIEKSSRIRLPEPLPETKIPDALPEVGCEAGEDLKDTVTKLLVSTEQLRVSGDAWERFWLMDGPRVEGPARCDAAPATRPAGAPTDGYSFRLPFSDVDLEIRVVPRYDRAATTRPSWRPSGRDDVVDKP